MHRPRPAAVRTAERIEVQSLGVPLSVGQTKLATAALRREENSSEASDRPN